MENKENTVYARLDSQAIEAVEKIMAEKGLTKSSAINTIIREWAEMKKQYVTVPIKGAVIEDGKITIAEELARR